MQAAEREEPSEPTEEVLAARGLQFLFQAVEKASGIESLDMAQDRFEAAARTFERRFRSADVENADAASAVRPTASAPVSVAPSCERGRATDSGAASAGVQGDDIRF